MSFSNLLYFSFDESGYLPKETKQQSAGEGGIGFGQLVQSYLDISRFPM